MKQFNKLFMNSILTTFLIITYTNVFSNKYQVIKKPIPNIEESKYVHLEKIKTLSEDLGNNEFLFQPRSLTINKNSNLYVYDVLQSKIFKFDENLRLIKAFGRRGQGPGEFSGTGINFPVIIKTGRDGNLYAHDLVARKIIVFDQNGKYIRDYVSISKFGESLITPIVDSCSNLYFFSLKDKVINIYNEKNIKLLSLPIEKESFDSLFIKPINMFTQNFLETLLVDLTLNSNLLIYFRISSMMYILKDKEIIKKMRIWPKGALNYYESEVYNEIKKYKNAYKSLFFNLFVDEDDNNNFYLHFGKNEKKNINALYNFNLNGDLIKVLYIKLKKASFTRFELKKEDQFYAIEDDKIKIYKERR